MTSKHVFLPKPNLFSNRCSAAFPFVWLGPKNNRDPFRIGLYISCKNFMTIRNTFARLAGIVYTTSDRVNIFLILFLLESPCFLEKLPKTNLSLKIHKT